MHANNSEGYADETSLEKHDILKRIGTVKTFNDNTALEE